MWIHCYLVMAWAEEPEGVAALDREKSEELVNEAMVDCPGTKEGSGESEVGAIIDSFKPRTRPWSLGVATTSDAISEVDMWYSIGVVNGGMGMVIAEEVSGVNDDVKDGGGMERLKVGESHRLGLSEMKGETQMPIDRSNGVVTFISTSPFLLDVMAMDEGDGEVVREEVFMLSPMLSP
eukprot:Gb_08814 [translate_table: standard]